MLSIGKWVFQVALMIKNPPLQVGDIRDTGNARDMNSILGWEDSLEKSMMT